jgi:glyoxylase-like metal-dependent hydrolase (beta-lactamase superfamily II)
VTDKRKGYDTFQNPTPGPPYVFYDSEEKLAVDFTNSRLFYETNVRQSRYIWRPLTVINGGKGYWIDRWARTATPIDSPSLDNYRNQFQRLPQFLLYDVLTERAASLRWLGEGVEGGRKQEIITFIDRNNRQVSLYFDARTKLLTKYEYLYTDPAAGDSRSEFIYQSYRNADGLKVPTGMINRVGGHGVHEAFYEDIRFNLPLDEHLFALPDNLRVVAPAAPSPAYRMTRIGNDVYLVENVGTNYNVLVVAFDDYILVAEAPESRPHARLSERVIAKIKEAIPGKPIKYLAFSHHRVDHGCGARAYIAEGATVITTPGNKRFVESMAFAKFAMRPDALARAPRRPAMEFVEKKRVIRDEHHVVEIYNIGPYWHAAEELIVYLPQEKLLFEGDLFTSGFGEDVGPAQDHPVLLAEKIKELGLDVQKIVGVHGRLRPIADLDKSIEKRNRSGMPKLD